MSSDHTDLIARIVQARDKAAFVTLFQHFAPRIKSYLLRLNISEDLAEDITQETMAQLWHKAHMFDPEKAALSTWLFRIARNRLIDARRKERGNELSPHEPLLQPSDTVAPDEALAQTQYQVLLKRMMVTLPVEQRELLVLSYFEGLSHGEIAEKTALP